MIDLTPPPVRDLLGPVLFVLVAVLVAFGLGAAAGWQVRDRDYQALVASSAQAAERAARDAAAALAAAQARADTLTLELHAQLAASATLRESLDEQLALATHGRPCLDPAALRLLDRAAQPAAAVPAPARRPAAARAAQPAADSARQPRPAAAEPGEPGEPAASDTEVARWAADAYHRYAACAARLDALIRWHADPPYAQEAP